MDSAKKTFTEDKYEQKKIESKRPPDLKFIQQKLPASHPVFNAAQVVPWMFLLSLIFIPLGIGIWIYADNIPELEIPYHDCISLEYAPLTCEKVIKPSGDFAMYIRRDSTKECSCRVNFNLKEDMNGTIYMYYTLTNFYQNHLRYSKSRDENQLKGNILKDDNSPREPSSSCGENHTKDSLNRTYMPCGLQASTMFNDVIQLIHIDPQRYPQNAKREGIVPLNKTGIAWESDKYRRFKNPPEMVNPKHPIWLSFAKPRGWKKNLWELDLNNPLNNGLRNEDFMVWMRTAAFPNFRKLHRIVDQVYPYQNGLPAGNYTLEIKEYNFEVTSFHGTKSIILTTSKMTAGRNYFLATAFLVTGGILFVLTIIFFGIFLFTRKRDLAFKND